MFGESLSAVPLSWVIEQVGSQRALARILGISQQAVSALVKRGSLLPPRHVLAVEAATGIPRHVLRPDFYPIEQPMSEPHSGGSPSAVQTPATADGIHNPLRGLER
ncbi:YdaS family helix-turn-helix protein [uncultured Novosphingobium sp.]|uniref:transcriptional regulator n=1 Tax=uncultured Novosphingobium sp. TaxID=292277 RepID=UPI00338EC965